MKNETPMQEVTESEDISAATDNTLKWVMCIGQFLIENVVVLTFVLKMLCIDQKHLHLLWLSVNIRGHHIDGFLDHNNKFWSIMFHSREHETAAWGNKHMTHQL